MVTTKKPQQATTKLEFLTANEARKLTTILCNHLSIGQAELGRAALRQLFGVADHRALLLLRKLIVQGRPSNWLCSPSLPSVAHFLAFCITELKDLSRNHRPDVVASLPPALLSRVEFELLIHRDASFDDDPPPILPFSHEVLCEIRRVGMVVFECLAASPPPSSAALTLSPQLVEQLRAFCVARPFVSRQLRSYLCDVRCARVYDQLHALLVGITAEYMANQNFPSVYEFLQCVLIPTELDTSNLEKLFVAFLPVIRDGKDFVNPFSEGQGHSAAPRHARSHPSTPFLKKKVYEALLSHDNRFPITFFCSLEDKDTLSRALSSPLPPLFRAFADDDDDDGAPATSPHGESLRLRHRFWNEFYTFMRVSEQHCIEYVLTQGLDFINNSRSDHSLLDSARALLAHFGPLKPLLLLLSWESFDGHFDFREQVMGLLWGERFACSDAHVQHACDHLVSQHRIAKWYSRKHSGNVDFSAVANQVLNHLQEHSFLHVVRPLLPILDAAETLQVYSQRPANNHVHHAEKELDLVLLHSYYSVRAVALLVHAQGLGTIDENTIETTLRDVREHIACIHQPVFRVSVLENILKLLFLRNDDWKEQHRPSHTEYAPFMLSASLLAPLLDLVVECVAVIKNQLENPQPDDNNSNSGGSGGAKEQPRHHESLWRRVRRLHAHTVEAKWRLGVLEGAALGLGPTWRPAFMHHMLASPLSLVNMVLVHSYYDLSKDVTRFFSMPKSIVQFVEIAEALDGISAEMVREGGSNRQGVLLANALLGAHLMTLRGYEAFLLFFDLALCAAPSTDHGTGLLSTAQSHLQRLHQPAIAASSSSFGHEGVSHVDPVITAATPSLVNQVERVVLLKKHFVLESIRSLLVTVETLPCDSAVLADFLEKRAKRLHALASLRHNVEESKAGNNPDLTVLLKRVIRAYTQSREVDPSHSPHDAGAHARRTTPHDDNDNNDNGGGGGGGSGAGARGNEGRGEERVVVPSSFFLTEALCRFLQYVLDMGEELCSGPTIHGHSDYFLHLTEPPSAILARLVFGDGAYDKAHRLAEKMCLDLIRVSLRCLLKPTMTHSSQSKEGDSSAQWDRVVSAKAPPPSREGQRAHDHKIEYPLNMHLVRHVGHSSAVLGVVACLTRMPVHRLDGEFLDYALTHSAQYPPLHQHTLKRAEAYSNFIRITLNDPGFPAQQDALKDTNHHDSEEDGKVQFVGHSAVNKGARAATEALSTSQFVLPAHRPAQAPRTAFAKARHSQPLASHHRALFELINTESGGEDDVGAFYKQAIEQLVAAGDYTQALRLADKHLDGAPDSLLGLLVEHTEDKSQVSTFIRRLRDKPLAATLVLKHLRSWDVSVCLDLLFMCKCHLQDAPPRLAALKDEVSTTLARMHTVKRILACDHERWGQWQRIADTCNGGDPERVVSRLVEIRQYALAREVATQYAQVSEQAKQAIEESFLFHLLTVSLRYGDALCTLVRLGDKGKATATTLLGRIAEFSTKLFLVQVLLTHLRPYLTPHDVALYTTKELGLQILTRMPHQLQPQYQHLVDTPPLIVESLLMSEHVLLAAHLFSQLPQVRSDDLIIAYAKKSLRIPPSRVSDHKQMPHDVLANKDLGPHAALPGDDSAHAHAHAHAHDGPRDTPPTHKAQWCLTGEAARDDEIREQHRYVTAPSVHLARALLDLCGDFNAAGKAALEVCDDVAALAADTLHEHRELVVDIVGHLLNYSRLQFRKHSDGYARVALCERQLGFLNVMRQVLAKDHQYEVALADFGSPERARLLRDRLIFDDYMHLAAEVCGQCGISALPVWSAWGKSLVRLGLYDDARDKFEKCLAQPHTSSLSHDEGITVEQIVELIENSPPIPRKLVERVCSRAATGAADHHPTAPTPHDQPPPQHFAQSPPVAAVLAEEGREALVEGNEGNEGNKGGEEREGGAGVGEGEGEGDEAGKHEEAKLEDDAQLGVRGQDAHAAQDTPAADAGLLAKQAGDDGEEGEGEEGEGEDGSGRGGEVGDEESAQTERVQRIVCDELAALAASPCLEACVNESSCLDEQRVRHCEHFLTHFAPPSALLRFYMRHALVGRAVACVVERGIDAAVFVDHVVKPSVRSGRMEALHQALGEAGLESERVQPLVAATTKFLRAGMHFALLHAFLVFTRNEAGAALTCIRLFAFASDYPQRVVHLQQARTHFQAALAQVRGARLSVGASEGNDGLSEAELLKNLNTVELQLEVSKWFAAQMPRKFLSLFGTHKVKCDIAELLLPHAFPLAQRILVDFRLPHVQVCSSAATALARAKQAAKLNELLANLKGKLGDKDWDQIVSGVVDVLARELDEVAVAERFSKLLKGDRAKLDAFVACNKLKAAFQLASKNAVVAQALQDVVMVKNAALVRLQDGKDDAAVEVVKWCNRFIASNQKATP